MINLALADLPKDTTSLDLALAIAVLQADRQLPNNLDNNYFIGELGLDGCIKPIRGLIGKLLYKPCSKAKAIYIAAANYSQASLVGLDNIYPVNNLKILVDHLNGTKSIDPLGSFKLANLGNDNNSLKIPDFAEIFEQDTDKRALIVAAAGGHNVLMIGPPGTGKSMLAKAFIGIMPDLTRRQSLEVTHLHSLSSHQSDKISLYLPLRSPHHTASDIAIIDGGHTLKPGEISLAHHGVLFLDELPEFSKHTIETLRQPLEDGEINIARAQQRVNFPANFTLIATGKPCPCGYLYSNKPCHALQSKSCITRRSYMDLYWIELTFMSR